MFASDHGLTENCEAVGNGDSGVYPGGAPETDDDTAPNAPDPRDTSFYPERAPEPEDHPLRHPPQQPGLLGHDGQRHPHRPQQHLRQHRRDRRRTPSTPAATPASRRAARCSRRTTSTRTTSTTTTTRRAIRTAEGRVGVGVPIGIGILIAGGNDDTVRGNHIYDNWRRGAMLLAVPDAISCPPGTQTCTPTNPTSTSYDNRFYDNGMGRTPSGEVRSQTGSTSGGTSSPATPATAGSETGGPMARTRAGPVTRSGSPARACRCRVSCPRTAARERGTGNPAKEAMLTYCAEASIGDTTCDWYARPSARAPRRPPGPAPPGAALPDAPRIPAPLGADVRAHFRHPELREVREPAMKPPRPATRRFIRGGGSRRSERAGRGTTLHGAAGSVSARDWRWWPSPSSRCRWRAVAAWEELRPDRARPRRLPSPGTAFLGTTTCADWRDATVARRMTIVQMLAVAATAP